MQKLLPIAFICIIFLQAESSSLGYDKNENKFFHFTKQCENVLTKNAGLVVVPGTNLSTSQVCGIRVDKASALHLMFRRKVKDFGGDRHHNKSNVLYVTIYEQKPSPSMRPLAEWRSDTGGDTKVVHREEIWLVFIYKDNDNHNEAKQTYDFEWMIAYAAEMDGLIPSCRVSALNLPANGIIDFRQEYPIGYAVNMQCMEGYVLEGGEEYAVCSVVNGQLAWIASNSICSSLCTHPPTVKHATSYYITNHLIDDKSFDNARNSEAGSPTDRTYDVSTNRKVFYTCQEPFVMEGLDGLECEHDHLGIPRWVGFPPSCRIPDCSTTINLRKSSGSMVNPSYPRAHLSGGSLTCWWEVSGDEGSDIHLSVTYLDLPDLQGVEVLVLNGEATNPKQQLLKLTNQSRPVSMVTRTSTVTVIYHGPPNEVKGYLGFYIRYRVIPRSSRHRRGAADVNEEKSQTSLPPTSDVSTAATTSLARASTNPTRGTTLITPRPATTSNYTTLQTTDESGGRFGKQPSEDNGNVTKPLSVESTSTSTNPTTNSTELVATTTAGVPSNELTDVSSQPSTETTTPPTMQPSTGTTTPPTVQPSTGTTTPSTVQPSTGTTTPPTVQPSTGTTTPPTMQPSTGTTTPSTVQPSTPPTVEPSTGTTTPPTVEPSTGTTTPPTVEPSTGTTTPPTVEPSTGTTTPSTVEPSTGTTTPPTVQPSTPPTVEPSTGTTTPPTVELSTGTTTPPTVQPSTGTTTPPTVEPSTGTTSPPTVEPSTGATSPPTVEPSTGATSPPTVEPSTGTTSPPTVEPSTGTTTPPTVQPSTGTTTPPTVQPSTGTTTPPTVEPSTGTTTPPTVEPSTGTTTQSHVNTSTETSTPPTVEPSTGTTTQSHVNTSTETSTPHVEPFTGTTTSPTVEPSTESSTSHAEQSTETSTPSAELSTETSPQGTDFSTSTLYHNATALPNNDDSSDNWKIAVGVVVPLLFLILVLVGVYICYRKKYPVRMIIGREFGKFTNPNYSHRAHAPSLVREDADFFFTSGGTLTVPSEDFNPVNNKIMYDNMGFIRDEFPDEDEKERKFLQNRSWLFKKTDDESEATVEIVAETTAESSFITRSLFTAERGVDEDRRDKRAYTDTDIAEILVEESPKPKPKPRLKKKAPSPPSSDFNKRNGQLGASHKTDINADITDSLRSSLSGHSGLQDAHSVAESSDAEDIKNYVKTPIGLFNQPSFDEVWAEVKARSKSLSTELAPDIRARSLSFDPAKSARKWSLHDDLQAASHLRAVAERYSSPLGGSQITAGVVDVDIRDRDSSFVSSVVTDEDSDEVSSRRKRRSTSSLSSDSSRVIDVMENESRMAETHMTPANRADHETTSAASMEHDNSNDGATKTKDDAYLKTIDEDSPATTALPSLATSRSDSLDETDRPAINEKYKENTEDDDTAPGHNESLNGAPGDKQTSPSSRGRKASGLSNESSKEDSESSTDDENEAPPLPFQSDVADGSSGLLGLDFDQIVLDVSKRHFSDSSSDSSDILSRNDIFLLSKQPTNSAHPVRDEKGSTSRDVDEVSDMSSDESISIDDKVNMIKASMLMDSQPETFTLDDDDDDGIPDSDIDV